MGHGNSNKLYVTHAEHSGMFGQHTASSAGFKAKQEGPSPAAVTPFDCCSLSFQPFSHPVCARNADGTGNVFDLTNIIPRLKQNGNKNPLTNEPLTPANLITLHYSRKPSGEIHDPISFKPFSEHSHIVAIATTGNVFLAASIKGGKDLVNDVRFKKEDVITLQNPHGLPPASVASARIATSRTEKEKISTIKLAAKPGPVAGVQKEAVPWNISPYSSGLPGASLTSTSVDPQTASSKLVWDEEELMFEEISRPVKGKSKEKDVGKRRAYAISGQGKYNDCLFHRLVPGFMIQTGDPTGTGSGGQSYWGTPFRDEYDMKGAAKHDSRGIVAMANKGASTNGSQFYVTFKATPHLDRKHTVFGKLVGGEDVLNTLERLPLKDGTERPAKPVKITEVIIYQDPFEDYKTRLAKKLARKAEAEESARTHKVPEKKEGDDINWFGLKIGVENLDEKNGGSGGVGKYLNLKRSATAVSIDIHESKKRKLGFGDFENF
ncbi:hypothetical protein EW146_g3407 [Bondarzewia mesenterica]|uniref:RING-type E3 ubiquitin transferase n=1 Tax=Bondarzewia mesenterica TaxID=1095465 RepID=A0A4S4M3J3_9AGAM|nr:hypothetical protein EW146_g3407 [Bondarzewia mesenterica]